jgi:hypothetical protein
MNSKKNDKILNNIVNELETMKHKSLKVSDKLIEQSDILNKTTDNLENISYQADVSKWQLNYISATFGKIYRNIHNYPIRDNAKKILKIVNLKSKILSFNFNNKYNNSLSESINEKNNDKLENISNLLNEIKEINVLNRNEIDIHNTILEYNNQLNDNTQNKIEKNIRKIKKIMK